tara:strand:- start:7769 stop:8425 length:657 start_codon:yes stop_codon:yes gene_type:complete
MFFHEDLDVYKNKKFRSYDFLKNIWHILESDFLYALGMINTGNITIVIDPDIIYLTVTSNFKHILDTKYNIDFSHSICTCDDFSVEIDIQMIDTKKDFNIDVEKCKLYFQNKIYFDEGIVEYSAIANFNISNYLKLKNSIFLSLAKEIQFAINKNILHLDISHDDFIIAELDAEFEIARAHSILCDLKIKESINQLVLKKDIFKQNRDLLLKLVDLIN